MRVSTELRVTTTTPAALAEWVNALPADAGITGRAGAFGVILRATWELSTPEPARPEPEPEPTGWLAVVEASDGRRWYRDGREDDGLPWFWAEPGEPDRPGHWKRRTYADIDVVRVLSQGGRR